MTSVSKKLPDGQPAAANSGDQSARSKSAVPNAWARGSTNPITQRPAGTSTVNGVSNNQTRANDAVKPVVESSKESNTPDRHANDRMVFLFANFIGLTTTITLRSGEKYQGIFSSFTNEQAEPKYVLKMVKKIAAGDKQLNGMSDSAEALCGAGQDHVMSFSTRDVADIHVPNVRLQTFRGSAQQNGANSFKTDTDISGGFATRERDLQRWDGGLESDTSMSLDGPSNGQQWDQFEANERLYGLKTNYDESFYTTTIDRAHPEYKQREARAAQLAKEIERSSTLNAHVAEERGHKPIDDKGEDEEDKYSGVKREGQQASNTVSSKYTPPARRAPSAHTTVHGAPVDPAIITSMLSKPQSTEDNDQASKANANVSADQGAKAKDVSKPEASASQSAVCKPSLPATKPSPGKEGSATATVEQDVVNAFKQFTATEKLKAQEHQRSLAKRDKAVKLNDLKKFAQNFKLNTEVPRDLIPILAKDKGKQDQIVQKALQNLNDHKTVPGKTQESSAAPIPSSGTSTTPSKQPASRPGDLVTPISGSTANDRHAQRNRQHMGNGPAAGRQANANQMPMQRQHPGIGQRLAQQYSRQPMPIPHQLHDPRLPPSGPSMPSGLQSPPGRQQYNLRAPEFRPNPSAHTFLPGTGTGSTTSPVRAAAVKPVTPKPGNFFLDRRGPLSDDERKPVKKGYNPPARVLKEMEESGKSKDYAQNGGIPQAYRTPPTWEVPEANKDIKYTQLFEKEKTGPMSPSHSMHPQQHSIPHQHQLPMHLQSNAAGPHGHTPHQTPRHNSVQPHMTPNGQGQFDDHQRMQFSTSTSSLHPSPRANMPQYAYTGQMAQPLHVHGQVMPGFGIGPGGYPMTMRQVSGGPQYMAQGMPQMGGHVMTNQASAGPYMQMNAQVPVYAAVPNAGYGHHAGPMTPQPSGAGFPSPRPPAPMMVHQSSQQGHPQMMYMSPGQHNQVVYGQTPTAPMRGPYGQQAHYGTSPHQPHHFPQPHRATPSANYAQPMVTPHMMQQAGAPNAGQHAGGDGAEDVK